MADFVEEGVGVKTLLRRQLLEQDFPGCYVFLSRKRPIYVGISRRVFRRLEQHVNGTTHSQASLAYRMARALRGRGGRKRTRDAHMKAMGFGKLFKDRKRYLAGLTVAYVEIDNALVRYVFEAYCATALDTFRWNTFETH
ncbi:MAG: hypothetical protein ACLPV8_01195 [Steroidobacteraceae bacterium]